jgi:hypothetical protein
MTNNNVTTKNVLETKPNQPQPRKPNEKMGFCLSSSLKITDTKTGEVLLKMRCS